MSIFSSTIIPTINRPTLSRAVSSVLEQRFGAADFEVIVVNDSGQALPSMDWQSSVRVQVINTNHRDRSVARNTGASIAKGNYLHFLDDDDWMLPGALDAIWSLSQSTDAIWLYGAYNVVDNDGNIVTTYFPELSGNIFAHLVAGEGIPIGASFFKSDVFFKVGLFDQYQIVEEIRDLGRRVAFEGNVAGTNELVHCIRVGQEGSTTHWSRLAENDRWGREKALGIQNALSRLRLSADTSLWRGRVSRAYFASAVWNLERKNALIAFSRAISGVAVASWHPISIDFWLGLKTAPPELTKE